MPSHGIPKVKCEPTSESDDDEDIYFPQLQSEQVPPFELRPVKHEPDSTTQSDVSATLLHHLQSPPCLEELAPAGPAATPVRVKHEPPAAATLQTLQTPTQHGSMPQEPLASDPLSSEFMPLLRVKDEPTSEGEQPQLSGDDTSDSCGPEPRAHKGWTQHDMDNALDALRKQNMSLTKASSTYGIPSTTLWQRAHRLGIDTPKKEGGAKTWSQDDLRAALGALRAGAISANKASKAYGIPSSTLYKIARREGIRLSAPFNAAPTSWRAGDLQRALSDIRRGGTVQRAAHHYGIPTGTLYGRCKREGIELSRANPTPWTEDAMGEAIEAVRVGQMSINQAAIHYNLPYSSLYGRFKRCKYPQSPQQLHQGPQECFDLEPPPEPYPPYHPPAPHSLQHIHYQPMEPAHSAHDTLLYNNMMVQEQHYAAPPMYYNQTHNTIATS